jgi:hypothetical protein
LDAKTAGTIASFDLELASLNKGYALRAGFVAGMNDYSWILSVSMINTSAMSADLLWGLCDLRFAISL